MYKILAEIQNMASEFVIQASKAVKIQILSVNCEKSWAEYVLDHIWISNFQSGRTLFASGLYLCL